VFGARCADIECLARHLEALGRARATIARRLCTVSCFYRYAEQEGLIAVSPAAHVRRPRLDYGSHSTGLDRNEVGAMLVAAGLATAGDHALLSVLAVNGLRVSEAIGADIEDLGLERGHRTLTILRKGGTVVTVPLAPRTARAIDLAVGERCAGPIFVAASGQRIDRQRHPPQHVEKEGAPRRTRASARRPGRRPTPRIAAGAKGGGQRRRQDRPTGECGDGTRQDDAVTCGGTPAASPTSAAPAGWHADEPGPHYGWGILNREIVPPPEHLFPPDEWRIVEVRWTPEFSDRTETALSNGYVGVRGVLDG
jgi:hypothetical protein